MSNASVFRSPAGRDEVLACYRGLLDGWPLPHTERSVATRYGDTFVVSCGPQDAPPVVLLHGSTSNSAMWLGEVAPIARRHRVHAVDLLDEPGLSAQTRLPAKGPAHVQWLDDVLAELGVQETALVGCSLGGWVALKFATAQPERVTKLALTCPWGVAPVRLSFLLRALPLQWMGPWGTRRLDRIVRAGKPMPKEVERFGALILRHVRPRQGGLPVLTDGELHRLTLPVLLIAGLEDALLPSQHAAERLAYLVQDFEAQLRPDDGHVLRNVGGPIAEFLQRDAAAKTEPVRRGNP